ncbi:MAG: ABC transporter ATP-binding protein [Hyalangium sp.]|uniref:ABC transporter ATP-binding protein n=1 Tax=Hyalangium sp. TaxID=2028555 RepID=UPI003899CBC9
MDGNGKPALVELRGVSKIYRTGDVEVAALRQVDFSVEAGDFVSIMGASGSGKSTLMNILGCLDRPTTGQYLLQGVDVSRLDKSALAGIRNRTLGFVFQSFNLLSRTSAQENVELPLLYGGVSARERRRRAREALERVGLGARLDHHPRQLSGGQQQRVAIARALVNRPPILLADEPTGNLDSRTTVEVMSLFQELRREGLTIIIVTHEMDVASYTERLVVVRDGRIRSDQRQVAQPAVLPELEEAAP